MKNDNLLSSDISIKIKGKEYSEVLLLALIALYSIGCACGVAFLEQDKFPILYNVLLGSGCLILLCWPLIIALLTVIRLRLKNRLTIFFRIFKIII
ncbi:hypothetical protein JE646_004324 [Salmonella enterica]|nr:hypothetical protein [Salmonella enterica]